VDDRKLHLVLRLELRELRSQRRCIFRFVEETRIGGGADDDVSGRPGLPQSFVGGLRAVFAARQDLDRKELKREHCRYE